MSVIVTCHNLHVCVLSRAVKNSKILGPCTNNRPNCIISMYTWTQNFRIFNRSTLYSTHTWRLWHVTMTLIYFSDLFFKIAIRKPSPYISLVPWLPDWSFPRSIAGPGDQASPDHGSIGYSSEYRYFGTFRGFSYVNTCISKSFKNWWHI